MTTQHHSTAELGRHLWRLPSLIPGSELGHLQNVAQGHAQSSFEQPQKETLLPLWAGNLFWCLTPLTLKNVFLCSDGISCGLICAHYLLPCQWAQLKRVCLLLLHSLPSHAFCDGRRWMRCHLAHTPRGGTHREKSLCSQPLGTFPQPGASWDSASFLVSYVCWLK